ncbi:hypothetical protein [Actinoplanes sp. L3-i22]|uniref:hypothetical protein n=1 Tax=Actinoplanes sp. L3-i22 TaxID=2836373 RepID=UPI001C7891B7|nr:hypothetical protein [Actinoplanes sp. L3-i22]BCY09238.1 hypothetical protein L3i22_043260 [Actinoplanes sp. L3-i22]
MACFRSAPGIEIVAEAGNGAEAVARAKRMTGKLSLNSHAQAVVLAYESGLNVPKARPDS